MKIVRDLTPNEIQAHLDECDGCEEHADVHKYHYPGRNGQWECLAHYLIAFDAHDDTRLCA